MSYEEFMSPSGQVITGTIDKFVGSKFVYVPATLSWAFLVAQPLVPAVNDMFFHNQFIADAHINTAVPHWANIVAGGVAFAHLGAKALSGFINQSFNRAVWNPDSYR